MALVEYEVEDHVGIMRFNRPERLNAFNLEMIHEFEGVFKRFVADDSAWAGILTGNGRAFCAGRDLKAELEVGHNNLSIDGRTERSPFYLLEGDKPVIAAVQGYAIGAGFYIALGCDLRIAADTAQFGMGELPTGVLGPYWLSSAEAIPWAVAAELTYFGERISAQRAHELHLINTIVPEDRLMATAVEWAQRLVKLPPLHVRQTKALMDAMRGTPRSDLLAREYTARRYLNALDDTREATLAFSERRAPAFTGR